MDAQARSLPFRWHDVRAAALSLERREQGGTLALVWYDPDIALTHPIAQRSDDETVDSVEVPAAVVCARCGRPECPGCEPLDDTTLPSGVVAIVPWERPGGSAWGRLWSTAGLVTRSPGPFFGALPNGPIGPAILFAVVCELTAIASSAFLLIATVFIVVPSFVVSLLSSAAGQTLVARLLLVGVPGFAGVMLLAHVLLGVSMNRVSRRSGGKNRHNQSVRFGLYSTGWDLLTSPAGLLVAVFMEGPRSAAALIPLSVGVASRASHAFARGVLQLDEARADRARRVATFIALAATFASVAALLLVLGVIVIL
jgi:hypothetical protein